MIEDYCSGIKQTMFKSPPLFVCLWIIKKIYPQAKWNVPWRKFSSHCKNFDILKYSIQVTFCSGFVYVAFTQYLFLLVNFLLVKSLNSLWKFRLWVGKKRKDELQLNFSKFMYICMHVCSGYGGSWVSFTLTLHVQNQLRHPHLCSDFKSLGNVKQHTLACRCIHK